MNPEEYYPSFNPYRVFKFVATAVFKLGTPTITKFQSLSGFQVRCNAEIHIRDWKGNYGFNPYRVFKFVATEDAAYPITATLGVSIPIGFSSSLQPKVLITLTRWHADVSIPIGFSSSLQQLSPRGIWGFQKGFNPYRVFKFVAT